MLKITMATHQDTGSQNSQTQSATSQATQGASPTL